MAPLIVMLAEANRGACGVRTWTRGREEDVSTTGCLWVVPVSACTQEFDLVKVDDDRLLLESARRPAKIVSRRPPGPRAEVTSARPSSRRG